MKTKLILSFITGVALTARAHPGHDESPVFFAQAGSSPSANGASKVTITISAAERVITANGLPDHEPGAFPNSHNPNTISAQSYAFRVPLKPQTNATARGGRGAWFGVALNGVPFEPGTAEFWNGDSEWVMEAKSGFINLGLDANNAHVQPTGAYHYHGLPTGLTARLGGDEK